MDPQKEGSLVQRGYDGPQKDEQESEIVDWLFSFENAETSY
jgi:hypothetical protein